MATGHLGSFTFGTNAVTLKIIEMNPLEEQVGAIATPDLSMAVGSGMTYDAEEIVENGEFELVFADDNNTNITLRTKQTCTWTKPLKSGLTNPATWAFTGFVQSVKHGSQKTGTRSIITVKVKVDGNITKTAGT